MYHDDDGDDDVDDDGDDAKVFSSQIMIMVIMVIMVMMINFACRHVMTNLGEKLTDEEASYFSSER